MTLIFEIVMKVKRLEPRNSLVFAFPKLYVSLSCFPFGMPTKTPHVYRSTTPFREDEVRYSFDGIGMTFNREDGISGGPYSIKEDDIQGDVKTTRENIISKLVEFCIVNGISDPVVKVNNQSIRIYKP